MTANELISQSQGLQASYYALKSKSKEIYSEETDRKPLIIAGFAQSSSIILYLTVEIALKGLLKSRFNKFPKIHDLKKLNNKPDENDKTHISII